MSSRVEVIAHRGFSAAAPENTLRAFEDAIACGADRIELDVQLSRDGVAFVLHDDLLDRTTCGKGAAADLDWESLRALDAGSWFGPEFRGERIPRLEEVLDLCRGKIPVNVEIKAGAVPRGGVAIEAVVAGAVGTRGLAGSVVVSSFDAGPIGRIGMIDPRIEIESLHDSAHGLPGVEALERARALGARGLSISRDELWSRPGLSREAHARGLRLKVYTVDDPREMERTIALGADGIFTNRPDRLLEVLGRGPR